MSPVDIPGFLDMNLVDLVGGRVNFSSATAIAAGKEYCPFRKWAQVDMIELDREKMLVVLQPKNPLVLTAIEGRGLAPSNRPCSTPCMRITGRRSWSTS
jgi:hypothetical protein